MYHVLSGITGVPEHMIMAGMLELLIEASNQVFLNELHGVDWATNLTPTQINMLTPIISIPMLSQVGTNELITVITGLSAALGDAGAYSETSSANWGEHSMLNTAAVALQNLLGDGFQPFIVNMPLESSQGAGVSSSQLLYTGDGSSQGVESLDGLLVILLQPASSHWAYALFSGEAAAATAAVPASAQTNASRVGDETGFPKLPLQVLVNPASWADR